MSWQKIVTDPDARKVFEAMDGPKYTWRTIGGIARQTGLPVEKVQSIILQNTPQVARFSSSPSISGSALVGLIEKVGR